MRFARIFMAVVIALSVALLPTAGSAARVAQLAEAAAAAAMAAAMDEAMGDMAAMEDCGAHHHADANHAKPCGQDADQCRFMAACAHLNFSMANVAVSPFAYPARAAARLPALSDHMVPQHGASPPFRPPRV